MPTFYTNIIILDTAQRANGAKMTSYRRRCDVITSHRRRYDAILRHMPAVGTLPVSRRETTVIIQSGELMKNGNSCNRIIKLDKLTLLFCLFIIIIVSLQVPIFVPFRRQ